MSSERFQQIRAIFARAVALPPHQRPAFLEDACGEDRPLLEEVQRLLDSDGASTGESNTDLTATVRVERGSLPPIQPGEKRIGPYRILRKIAEGGMGVVYEAEQIAPFTRRVALKVIKQGLVGKQVLARFEAERQALAMMNHPNVAKVLDAGTEEHGAPYFVMEFIRGDPITEYCDRNCISTRDRLELMIAVCDGVQHAHQKGIIHRDLSPSNVLIEIQDGRPVPRIIDFGIAKAIDRDLTDRTLHTEKWQVLGKPEYMSPEQAEMTGVGIDTRTDVYSLGVMLYELLVGELPFSSSRLREAGIDEMRRVIREETPVRPSMRLTTQGELTTEIARVRASNPSALEKSCRGDLDWIAMKALEKDQTRRYGSASDFGADLRRHLDNEAVVAGPPSAAYQFQKFVRRHRAGVAAASLVVAVVLIGLVVTSVALVKSQRSEAKARREANRATVVSDFLVDMFEQPDPAREQGNATTARELLDRGAERIHTEMAEEPETRARLLLTIGRTYMKLGHWQSAEPLLEESYRLHQSEFGASDDLTINAGDGLAWLYREQERWGDLLVLRTRTHEQLLEAFGSRDRRTLKAHLEIGRVHLLEHNLSEAEPVLREVLESQREALGPDDPLVLESEHELAVWYANSGHDDEAADRWIALSERVRRVLGADHDALLTSLRSLAMLEWKRKNYKQTEEYATDALAISLRKFGENHPSTLRDRQRVALSFMYQDRWEKAEVAFRDNIAAKQRILGEAHPHVYNDMLNLAHVLERQDSDEEAEDLLWKIREFRISTRGEAFYSNSAARRLLVELWIKTREYEKAVAEIGENLPSLLREFGAFHRVGGFAGRMICRIVRETEGQPLWAETLRPHMKTILEAQRREVVSDLADVDDKNTYAWNLLTSCMKELQDPAQALRFAREVNELTDHQDADYVDTLALALHRVGRSDEAERLLRDMLETLDDDHDEERRFLEERLAEILG